MKGIPRDLDVIPQYRNGDITENDIVKLVEDLRDSNIKAEKPDLEKLEVNNELRKFPDVKTSKLDGLSLYGEYCHPMFSVINNMMVNGMSPVIFVVGDRRLGKSKAAYYIADMVHRKLNICPGEFEPNKQLLYDELEFLLLILFAKRVVQVADEAHRYLDWRSQHSEYVKAAESVLDTMAIHNNLHIVVTPKYKKIVSGIRSHADFIVEMTGKQEASVTWYQDKYGKKGNRGLDFKFDEFPDWNIPDIPQERIESYESIENDYKYEDLLGLIEKVAKKRMEEKETDNRKRF